MLVLLGVNGSWFARLAPNRKQPPAQRASHSPSPAQQAGKGPPDHAVFRPNGPTIRLRLPRGSWNGRPVGPDGTWLGSHQEWGIWTCPLLCLDLTGIDWVIVGGESGAGARPMRPDWVLSLRDQCLAAGVPFFFKQWGGVQKSKAGRLLEGRTHDALPPRTAQPAPTRERRLAFLAEVSALGRLPVAT